MAERAVKREQRVGAQIFVSGKRAVVPILAHRSPAGKQRPHRAEVVAAAAEPRRAGRDDAHAPVRLLIEIAELGDHGVGFPLVEQAEPHRHGREHARFVHGAIVLVQRKSEALFIGKPESVVHERPLLGEFLG